MTAEAMSPSALAAAGFALGLSGGLAPGPLSALVVRQSLQFGTREGIKVALAPLITDGPLLVAAGYLAHHAESFDTAVGVISLLGAAFLLYLAWESVGNRGIDLRSTEGAAPGSALKGVLTNLLNPHAYLFWVIVGGPLLAQAWQQGSGSTAAFVGSFFGTLCGAKVALAWAVGAHRERIGGPVYTWTMRGLALALVVFAVLFVRDGLERLI